METGAVGVLGVDGCTGGQVNRTFPVAGIRIVPMFFMVTPACEDVTTCGCNTRLPAAGFGVPVGVAGADWTACIITGGFCAIGIGLRADFMDAVVVWPGFDD